MTILNNSLLIGLPPFFFLGSICVISSIGTGIDILFILPSDKRKYHIKMFSQAVLTKNLGDDIALFLTTRNEIKAGEVNWEEIKPEEE